MDLRPRFDATFRIWMPAIQGAIETVFEEETPRGSALLDMGRYHLSTGGKRIRALLPLLVAEDLGADPAALVPFGAACEVLHNATLIHDDLQDGDTVRRGQPTVWAKYGQPQAINVGDAAFYWAVLLVHRLPVSPERRERAVGRLLRETLRVIDGQEREFALKSHPNPAMDDYFTMVEGKTSGLFALPLAGAAELCGSSPLVVAALSEAARHLGVLFQLQDDVLDLYGDKGRDAVGSDVREGKRSAMVVHALRESPPADARRLREILDRPRPDTTADDVAWTLRLFRTQGSLRYALEEVLRRARLASAIPELPPRLGALVSGLAALCVDPIRDVILDEVPALLPRLAAEPRA